MNKMLFKKEIDGFLNELNLRREDVQAGNLYANCQIGKSIKDFVKEDCRDEFPIVYSTGSIKLDSIFHLGLKGSLHNASNFTDIKRLANAIQYEILANKSRFEGITEDEFYYVYWGYLVILMKNFNWCTTFNTQYKNEFGMKSKKTVSYLLWMESDKTNIFSNNAVSVLYKKLFIDNDNTVLDINGEKKQINIKNTEYNTMKRLSKEDIITIINQFEEKPSVKQIVDAYMKTVELYDTDNIEDYDEYKKLKAINNSRVVSPELMRKYIKEYELTDLIKSCNHSQNFIKKLAKKQS